MRLPRHVVRTVVLLFLVLYFAAHLAIRASWCQRYILDSIAERTGYDVTASSIRFGPFLALAFKDVRVTVGSGDSALPLFEARNVRVTRRGGAWCAEAPRASLYAYRGADGAWTPAGAQPFGEPGCFLQQFARAGLLNRDGFFVLKDATFTIREPGRDPRVFAGLEWSRLPADVPGVRNAVANQLSVQGISGVAGACPVAEPAIWLEVGNAVQPISAVPSAQAEAAALAPAPVAAPAAAAEPAPAPAADPAPVPEAEPAPAPAPEPAPEPAPLPEAAPAPVDPVPAPAPEEPAEKKEEPATPTVQEANYRGTIRILAAALRAAEASV